MACAVLRRGDFHRRDDAPREGEVVRYERGRLGEMVHLDVKKLGRSRRAAEALRPGLAETGSARPLRRPRREGRAVLTDTAGTTSAVPSGDRAVLGAGLRQTQPYRQQINGKAEASASVNLPSLGSRLPPADRMSQCLSPSCGYNHAVRTSGALKGRPMPNGGLDNCGTCIHFSGSRGLPRPGICTLRKTEISDPYWTYCLNHHYRGTNTPPTRLSSVIGTSAPAPRVSPRGFAVSGPAVALPPQS